MLEYGIFSSAIKLSPSECDKLINALFSVKVDISLLFLLEWALTSVKISITHTLSFLY